MVQVRIQIDDHCEIMDLGVSKLGNSDLFLGHDWLQYHNPEVNWTDQILTFSRCPSTCWNEAKLKEIDEEKEMLRSFQTKSAEIAFKNRKERAVEEIILKHYLEYKSVFEKHTYDELPPRQQWDHAIDLIPGSKPTDCKLYPLYGEQQQALEEFVKENLETGQIRPSKSPMASPFFFIKKKDGKLRPVQDYRKLNEQTIKNKYPLPLISELVDKVKGAKYFSKMDIHWGYNNIRIKEGDEWKAAFKTNRGLFEPTVMFFGLCNSPATFQNMMNDIF